ncbi:MAG TPA: VOC family protein [Usitatibacter sp.]|nr:VOC family protein [Usitatibacter sp.]
MAKVDPIPQGFHTVTPHLIVAGAAQAIEFYKKAFGAVEEARIAAADGKLVHARIRIGDSPVMLMDEAPPCGALGPRTIRGTPVAIHLYVRDADAVAASAEEAGAKVVMPVSEQFWGDRYGVVEDPYGHQWSIATHVREVGAQEMRAAMEKMAAPA